MTSTFNYLMVLYSIIIGVSMADILAAIGHIIQGNKSVNNYWVHSAWVFMIFYLHVFIWFSAWQYAAIELWTIASFFVFLMTPVTLFLASVVALPEIDPGGKYDMRSYYFRNYRSIYALLVIIIVLNAGAEYLLLDQDPFTIRNIIRALAAFSLIVGIFFSRPFMHGIQVSWFCALIGYFTLSYRESISG